VKRYRPGAPPASPHIGARALPGTTGPVITAPQGTKIMSSPQFGIAVPRTWLVGSDPARTFGQLRQDRWGEPRVATSPDGEEAIVVAPLGRVAHDPLIDPEIFWSDQVVGAGPARTVSDSTSIGIHGLRGTYVVVNDRSGSLVAAAIETRHGVFLVGFRGPSDQAANDRFQRLVQTFDVR
jgi:hypothetical protein